jgi:hypothetical protein
VVGEPLEGSGALRAGAHGSLGGHHRATSIVPPCFGPRRSDSSQMLAGEDVTSHLCVRGWPIPGFTWSSRNGAISSRAFSFAACRRRSGSCAVNGARPILSCSCDLEAGQSTQVMRFNNVWWVAAVVAGLGCAARLSQQAHPAGSEGEPAKSSADATWTAFWQSKGVAPAPPRDFLEYPGPAPEVLNLTNGAISDETASRWVAADLRRGKGDEWAMCHLRLDVANAGILGPRGLNGTDEAINEERVRGAVGLDCSVTRSVVDRVAVVAIPEATRRRIPEARLTDFVIVQRSKATGRDGERIFADGHRERVQSRVASNQPRWQLDAGEFREDPVVGPLWYQAEGWSCRIDGTTRLDEICRLVQPAAKSAAVPEQALNDLR